MNVPTTSAAARAAGAAVPVSSPGMDLRPVAAARANLRQADPVLQPGRHRRDAARARRHRCNPGLVRHLVLTSDVTGVFNFGGDLSLFVLLVRAQDVESLRLYGRRCIDMVWWMETAAQRGVHTTVLVQGDTLGGGLESVMPFHKVIFERSAQAGFPEVLFNLFPGMGAWQLHDSQGRLRGSERDGPLGQALHRRAALPAQPRRPGGRRRRGRGGDRARRPLDRSTPARHAGGAARRSAWPRRSPTSRSLRSSTCGPRRRSALTDRDLRLMERLARAQVRKVGGADEGAVEEIKRIELDTAWGEERTGITEWTTAQLSALHGERPRSRASEATPASSRAAGRACRAWPGGHPYPASRGAHGVFVEGVGGEGDDRQAAAGPAWLRVRGWRGWRHSRPSPASGSPSARDRPTGR